VVVPRRFRCCLQRPWTLVSPRVSELVVLGVLTGVLLAVLAPSPAEAASSTWVVYSPQSGAVLSERAGSRPVRPASLTKLMTAYIVLGTMQRPGRAMHWDSVITASARAARQPPTRLALRRGEKITVRDALRALMVQSANDVSVALAEHVGGTQARFIRAMNLTARRLGMINTRYANPSGLPAKGQYTTAADTAVLVHAVAHRFESARSVLAAREMNWRGRRFARGHRLLDADTLVLKTGFTCHSGYNVAVVTARRAHELVVVVLGASSRGERDALSAKRLRANMAVTGAPQGIGPLQRTGAQELNRLHLAASCR
jgi:D-alanyl-D-alanine carboxypeptidase